MRLIGAHTRMLFAEWLPRIARERLLGWLGHPGLDCEPFSVGDLAGSSAAAAALEVLSGRGREVVNARRAAVHAARGFGPAPAPPFAASTSPTAT